MDSYSSNKSWKDFLIVILLLACIGMGGYIYYDKIYLASQKADNVSATPAPQNEIENTNVVDSSTNLGKKLDVDMNLANDRLDDLNTFLHFALDPSLSDWYLPERISYEKELLDTDAKKMDFVYGIVANLEDERIISDTDINGEEVTGAKAVPLSLLKQYYRNIFGEELATAEKYSSGEYGEYVVKDDMVYGAFWSGWNSTGTLLRFVSVYQSVNNEYTLIADVITGEDTEMEYRISGSNDYKQSDVNYQLKLTLKKVNENVYTIQSMQAIEKAN